MNTKLMLAIAAMLGFSTACSSVKKSPQHGEEKTETADSEIVRTNNPDTLPRMVVMYGVPVYKPDSTAVQRIHQGIRADELPPVSEKAHDEEDPQPIKSSSQTPKRLAE